jgi:hypothetical protein
VSQLATDPPQHQLGRTDIAVLVLSVLLAVSPLVGA